GSLPNPLPAGSSDTVVIPLNNKTLTNRLRMQVHAHTPGGTVLTTSDKDITVDMDLSNPFAISAGTAIIPAIDKNFASAASLASAHLIESATLESGTLSLTLGNTSLISASLTVNLPDLKSAGAPLSVVRTVAPNSTQVVALDLTGYTLEPSDLTLPQSLDIIVLGHVDSSGGSYVNFSANDSLSARATVSNLAFSGIRGVFDSITTTFAPVVQSISVPNGFDSAQLTAATLTLEIDNGSALDGSLDLLVQGNNGQTLALSGAVAPGSSGSPITTAITESNLSAFLNPIPSSITVTGTAVFGDGVTTTDITKNDYIKARVSISSPLEVVFNGSTVTVDPESSEIDTADIGLIT
ncbi:MAG TPA: hypothetical protein VLB27_09500, partial [candidate division Zixibacteria bacterium]|nr:hypothetical protein [candidate division Zixibacteria bacterium]